jgi:CRISPR-associated endonuclease Csn1
MDEKIRTQVLNFLEKNPTDEQWIEFTSNLRQSEKNGGSSVIKTAVIKSPDTKEYMNFDKTEGKKQLRRGAKHQGQFVYLDEKGKAKVVPVYAFESINDVKLRLAAEECKIIDFFTAGCLIEIKEPFDYCGRNIPSGIFQLGSLWANGQVKILNPDTVFKNPIHINDLVQSGIKRVWEI